MQSGRLAQLAGVSTDTLRYYERLGLLPKPARTSGGYRDYSPEALPRIQMIRRALRVGFCLGELALILKMRERGEIPCHKVRGIANSRLRQVRRQIEDLTVIQAQLERTLKQWNYRLAHTPRGKPARLLENLSDVVAVAARAPISARHRYR